MLPVGIDQAGPDPPVEVGPMTVHTNLGVNFLSAMKTVGKGKRGDRQAYEKDRERM